LVDGLVSHTVGAQEEMCGRAAAGLNPAATPQLHTHPSLWTSGCSADLTVCQWSPLDALDWAVGRSVRRRLEGAGRNSPPATDKQSAAPSATQGPAARTHFMRLRTDDCVSWTAAGTGACIIWRSWKLRKCLTQTRRTISASGWGRGVGVGVGGSVRGRAGGGDAVRGDERRWAERGGARERGTQTPRQARPPPPTCDDDDRVLAAEPLEDPAVLGAPLGQGLEELLVVVDDDVEEVAGQGDGRGAGDVPVLDAAIKQGQLPEALRTKPGRVGGGRIEDRGGGSVDRTLRRRRSAGAEL
jgi:hypothetical protein